MMWAAFGSFLAASLAFMGLTSAAPSPPPPPSKVAVPLSPSETVVGTSQCSAEAFRGIPYAHPPTGGLRLKPPARLDSLPGTFDATHTEAACPQFFMSVRGSDFLTDALASLGETSNLPWFQNVTHQSEDCLTVNVIRPAGTKAGDALPVLFWIFGGGFELGWTSMYDGSSLVSNGISVGKPFVFVAVNYRVGGFGFMPGREILADGSANLGLLDQRMGLEWVADNIAAFGGDPDKVTIWGESAGAISVVDQMVLYEGRNHYKGKPLFRGAILSSGSLTPADAVDCPKGQGVYDTVVEAAGCSSADETLACLRGLDYTEFLNAANSVPSIMSYDSVALSYLPRPDGTALTQSPDELVLASKYAAVPMIVGSQEDEGTLFSLTQGNVTDTSDLVGYLSGLFFHGATKEQMTDLVSTYPASATAGSPFRTGVLNEIYPGFKRLAAILGDLVFTLTRRTFLKMTAALNPTVPAWSYLSSYGSGTPVLGTFHGADLLQIFYGVQPNYASKSIQSYHLNFVYNLDPNDYSGGTKTTASKVAMDWPEWGKEHMLMHFWIDSGSLLEDNFRNESYNFILDNAGALHV